MNIVFVEVEKQLEEILKWQFWRPLSCEVELLKHRNYFLLKLLVRVVFLLHFLVFLFVHFFLLLLHPDISQQTDHCLVIKSFFEFLWFVSKHLENFLMFESSLQSFVFSKEAYSQEAVPLQKINIRQRTFGFYPNDAALDLRGRFEVIFADFY